MTTQVSEGTRRSLRNSGVAMIVLLGVQYILGMVSNLFVQFPEAGTENQMFEFARTQLPEISHIILGLLLFVFALVFWIRAIRARFRAWTVAAGIGLLAILIAVYSGARFIPTQDDLYSLLMSLAFILALLAYVWGLLAARNLPAGS